ncbi:MAG TPA: DNRLRE domain-containing protein [Rugosimonospora sp.]|nr:DNRLRE domain-containing protein [Rugosimonospora sp.]
MTVTIRGLARRLVVAIAAGAVATTGTVSLGGAAFAAESARTVQFTASDDAYTVSRHRTTHTGSQPRLVAGSQSGSTMVAYLKFRVAGLPGAVRGATLTLVREQRQLPGTLRLALVGTGWSEGGLSAANAPRPGRAVATVHPTRYASRVTFNVGSVVHGPGVYAFALTASGHGAAYFRSAQSAYRPLLSVQSVVPDYAAVSPQRPVLPTAPQGGTPPQGGTSPSASPTASPTTSPSAPQTRPTASASPVPSSSPTATASPTPTASPSASPTTAPTPTASPSAPPTASPSPSNSTCGLTALLVPTCNILWGAAAGGFTTTPRDTALRDWEQASGRSAQIYHTYHRGDELFPTSAEIAMAHDPATPRLLLMNWKVAYGTTWAKVAAGAMDARIDREAAYLKSHFTDKFYLVLHHEPENDVNPAAGSGMTAPDFAAMFRHTVLRLRADGVGNAVFVIAYLSSENWFNASWWSQLYPGDDVVDWIGLDTYVTSQPGAFHFGDFTSMMDRTSRTSSFPGFYNWATRQHPNKPFMIAEWGTYEYTADPSLKARTFSTVLDELAKYPAVKAMVYFDTPHNQAGLDTRIDSSAQSLAQFRRIAADPRFEVRIK